MNSNPRRLAFAALTLVALLVPVSVASVQNMEPPMAEQSRAAAADEPPTKTIKLYAENWKWTPKTIRVKQGTRLVLKFDSRDAPHSFELKAYGIEVPLPQDSQVTHEFIADKAGTFRWRCGRPCGNGCPKMAGKLIVEK